MLVEFDQKLVRQLVQVTVHLLITDLAMFLDDFSCHQELLAGQVFEVLLDEQLVVGRCDHINHRRFLLILRSELLLKSLFADE